MAKKNNYKIKLLVLYEILRKNSDEQHPLNTHQLIEMLKERGISCDRKILYKDIQELNKYGFEVMTERHHYLEFYVLDRDFDDSELRVLMDAVQAANFISKSKSESLIGRIAALSGDKRAELLKRTINNIEGYKTTKNTFYDVDQIQNAILEKKLIKFKYYYYTPSGEKEFSQGDKKYTKDINEAKVYTMLPIDLVIQNNDYYVRTYNLNKKCTTIYKIGRMEKVMISNEKYEIDDDFKKAKEQLKNNAFNMYQAEVAKVTLRYNKNKASQIFEKFGAHVYRTYDENHFEGEVEVALAPPFYAWCATYGGDVTIIAPKKAIDEYKNQLNKCLEQYNEK